MRFKVLKECVIEGRYYAPGDIYKTSERVKIRNFTECIPMANCGLCTLSGLRKVFPRYIALLINKDFIEPIQDHSSLPDNIRKMLQVWIDCNENPITKIAFLNLWSTRPDGLDRDGFYCYTVYGYVNKEYNNLSAVTIDIRLKEPLGDNFNRSRDYSLEELGLRRKK